VPPPCLYPGAGSVDLEIAPALPRAANELAGPPALSRLLRHPEGDGLYEVWRAGDALILKVAPVAEFLCRPGRLEVRPLSTMTDEALRWQIYGLVMSVWSEWVGRPVLHAASVQVEGRAIGFLGNSGAGKSSLTLDFLTHGHAVYGDDQLILDVSSPQIQVRPAVPWLKISPELAESMGFDAARLPLMHSVADNRRVDLGAGQWAEASSQLGPIYLVERGWHQPEVAIDRLGPSESLFKLIQYSYSPRTVAAVGLSGQRLEALTRASAQSGVWRLRSPTGLEWLSRARSAIVQHVTDQLSEFPVPSPR
jgi:hypothetical protein